MTYFGVNFKTLRKALYLLYFGSDNGACNDFNSPKYKYIIPMQGNFENPLQLNEHDTYMMYWIEKDESLTQDDFSEDDVGEHYNRQKCVASVLLRFIGKDAEDWVKVFRHLFKRKGTEKIWEGVCNGTKLQYTSPVIPRRMHYSGMNSQIAFDVRFKISYDELINTGWEPLEGIDFTVQGELQLEEQYHNK